MDDQEAQAVERRLNAWRELERRSALLTEAIGAFDGITGNYSRVQSVTRIVIRLADGSEVTVDSPGLTDWQVKQALVPLIERRLIANREQREAI